MSFKVNLIYSNEKFFLRATTTAGKRMERDVTIVTKLNCHKVHYLTNLADFCREVTTYIDKGYTLEKLLLNMEGVDVIRPRSLKAFSELYEIQSLLF